MNSQISQNVKQEDVKHDAQFFTPPAPACVISANGLNKVFKSRNKSIHAVRDVSFNVHKGEIVGFLGPNGATK